MKKIQFIIASVILLFSLQSMAQISVNLNIGSRPVLNENYHHDEVSYYYYPEIEAYFDTYESVYIYYGPQGWIRSQYLPEYCHNYDIDRGYRVAIDYRGNSPFAHFKNHKRKYYRNCDRNYREEFYRPYNREVVVYNDHINNHDDHDYYKKQKHNKSYKRGYSRR